MQHTEVPIHTLLNYVQIPSHPSQRKCNRCWKGTENGDKDTQRSEMASVQESSSTGLEK